MVNFADHAPLWACSWLAAEVDPSLPTLPAVLPGWPLNSPPPPPAYHALMVPSSIPADQRACTAAGTVARIVVGTIPEVTTLIEFKSKYCMSDTTLRT